jgi:flagellar export protein FliJ
MSDPGISTLGLLARLEREKVSGLAQRYAALRSELGRLQQVIEDLGDRMETEALATSAETAPYVGAFISAIRIEIERNANRQQQLRRDTDALQSELREHFQRVKVVEVAEARRRLAVQTLQQKRDEREWTEAMLLRHIHNRRPKDAGPLR